MPVDDLGQREHRYQRRVGDARRIARRPFLVANAYAFDRIEPERELLASIIELPCVGADAKHVLDHEVAQAGADLGIHQPRNLPRQRTRTRIGGKKRRSGQRHRRDRR